MLVLEQRWLLNFVYISQRIVDVVSVEPLLVKMEELGDLLVKVHDLLERRNLPEILDFARFVVVEWCVHIVFILLLTIGRILMLTILCWTDQMDARVPW